jgi:Flp pilus assembly protein TadG
MRRSLPNALRARIKSPLRAMGAIRRLTHGQSSRRGSVALEFALASTPLMAVVFGFVAVMGVFNMMTSMQSNAQYASRLMSTGQITKNANGSISSSNSSSSTTCSSSMTSTQVEYYACNGLPSWATYTVTTAENCATPSVTVGLSTSASTAAIADLLAIFTGKTISQQVVLMKEGTCP